MDTYFEKQNSNPIPLEWVEHEHDENLDFKISFWFNNRRYMLEDFIRTHNNPFLGYDLCCSIPDYIHGIESENYHNPIFIEILPDRESVNVYLEKEEPK